MVEDIGDKRGQPYEERFMDDHNNAVGREIGGRARSFRDIPAAVYEAYRKGRMILFPPRDNDADYRWFFAPEDSQQNSDPLAKPRQINPPLKLSPQQQVEEIRRYLAKARRNM